MYSLLRKIQPNSYVAAGQIILGVCVLICVLIIPHYFFSIDQGGISNYGADARTRPLFVAGFGAATLGALFAAITLTTRKAAHYVRAQLGLYILTILYLLVMLSTFSYKLNDSLKHFHEQVALALFFAMFVGALWLRPSLKNRNGTIAFGVFFVGIGLGILTFANMLHVLFAIQIMCGTSFGYMLVNGLSKTKTKEL